MKIVVCIKQVPDTEAKIKIGANHQIDPTGVKWIMNPYDEYAVEEAIKMREKNPGTQVLGVTLGPKSRVGESLRTALAMGVDEAILIDAPSDLEPLIVAKALATVLQQEGGAEIVFTGRSAIDDNASSVPQMLAEYLQIPHSTVVTKLSQEEGKLVVHRETEGGQVEIVELTMPALVAANKGLNLPRYATLPGIMKAKKKIIKEINFNSLGVSMNAKTKVIGLELPPDKPPVKMMSGELSAQVSSLVKLLRDESKVL